MSETDRWEDVNERHLSLALHWLRLRLEELARSQGEVVVSAAPVTGADVLGEAPLEEVGPARRRRWLRRAPAREPAGERRLLALEAGAPTPSAEGLARQLAELEGSTPPPALALLAEQLGLSRFERSVLLLCAAMDLDTRIPGLCARAQDDPDAAHPTFALALALFDEPSWDALAPAGGLRHWRLVEVHRQGARPLTTAALWADERAVNFLKGLNHMDDRLSVLVRKFGPSGDSFDVPPSQASAVAQAVDGLRRNAGSARLPVVQLLGADQPSKELVARAACAEVGLVPYVLAAELLPTSVAELETLGRLWERETRLAPVALYVDALESDPAGPEGQPSPLNRFLARTGGVVLLDTRDVWPGLARATVVVDVRRPTAAEQQDAWGVVLGERAEGNPPLLSGQFDLSLAAIEDIARTVLDDQGERPLGARLWEACLGAARPRLDALAERLEPKATWNDIVLPEQELALLWELANQIEHRAKVYGDWGFRQRMNRGLGISALFAGESGTGKTMAAEVLASHLRLNLYRIDLSAVVSKYIGETEKNLRRLFDAAEGGGAILFFDEADALFGKRSEVKDSHDRYANIEINYLLQRMETYRGLAILGTNMKEALDQAFLRRLRFIVRFPFPAAAQRREIWERAFPTETPVADLDFDRLARVNLAGGSIHAVALNAAFLAAQARTPVTMEIVLGAARTELRKLDRPINEAELRWEAPLEPALSAVAVGDE